MSESLNLKDLKKIDKPKRLEISTEFGAKMPVTPISHTTKNNLAGNLNEKTPTESVKKNVVSHYSFEFVSKFAKNGTGVKLNQAPEEKNLNKSKGNILNRHTLAQEKSTLSYKKIVTDKNGTTHVI